jgi:hypothetical protein
MGPQVAYAGDDVHLQSLSMYLIRTHRQPTRCGPPVWEMCVGLPYLSPWWKKERGKKLACYEMLLGRFFGMARGCILDSGGTEQAPVVDFLIRMGHYHFLKKHSVPWGSPLLSCQVAVFCACEGINVRRCHHGGSSLRLVHYSSTS